MDLLPPLEKQAVVGHLLSQGMFEDVLQLRKQALLVDKLQSLKVNEIGFELLSHSGDGVEDAVGKVSPDDGSHLHGPLEVILQAVHAGSDDPLNGIGHLDIGGLCAQNILMIFPLNGAIFQQGVGKLLYEEGVASRSANDEFPQLRHYLSLFKDGLHQLSAGPGGELIHTDLAVIRLASPLVGVFRTVEKNEQDTATGQPAYQIG